MTFQALIDWLLDWLFGRTEPPVQPSPPAPVDWRDEMLGEHNRQRADRGGLPELWRSPVLDAVAQQQAEHCAATGRLTHTDSSGRGAFERARAMGYAGHRVGENVAWNTTTPLQTVWGWMDSVGHKANILQPKHTDAGFGMARGVNGDPYWCAVYGGHS